MPVRIRTLKVDYLYNSVSLPEGVGVLYCMSDGAVFYSLGSEVRVIEIRAEG